jgi:O-antigen ligase
MTSRQVASAALLLVPVGLMAFFAFNSGGFYPGPPAYAAIILCALLLIRVMFADRPFEGMSWPLVAAIVAMSIYTLVTLLSQYWSHSPGLALVEFDRALLYLLALVLCGSVARRRVRIAWVVRALTAGIVVVCGCGLITRILPRVWPIVPEFDTGRLSFPVTYWNVLGLLAAIGIILCAHLSSEPREPPAGRVLAAASLPMLAATLLFTYSRGAIAVCGLGLIAYVLIGRPRLVPSTLIAGGPATAVALKFAYDADLLSGSDPTSSGAVVQGHRVAIALVLCILAAAGLRALLARLLDWRLESLRLSPRRRRHAVRAGYGTVAVIGAVAVGALSGIIAHEWHLFVGPPTAAALSPDVRDRLTDPSNEGRLDYWRVSWEEFKRHPVVGNGAGTFENTWAQLRPASQGEVVNAHSLYMETLDELGLSGFLPLLAVILLALGAALARARGPNRALYAAVFAVLLAWAVEAGADWAWEMPVVTVIFFAFAGIVLAARARDAEAALEAGGDAAFQPSSYMRVLLGLGCILLAVAPAFVWDSQRKLDEADYAFANGNCRAATSAALSSIRVLGSRPEPYEVLGYCDIRSGMPNAAITAVQKAVSLDPGDWNYVYDLAVIRAAAGVDPRSAARQALALDPHQALTQEAWTAFSTGGPGDWQSYGTELADSFTKLQ